MALTVQQQPPRDRPAPSRSALADTVLAVLCEWGPLPQSALAEVLFYCDCNALVEKGQPLTEAAYLATRRGVRLQDQERQLAELAAAGLVRLAGDIVELTASGNPDLDTKGLLAEVKGLQSQGRLKISENSAWQMARSAAQGGNSPQMDLHLGMQQFVANDEWLREPFTKEQLRVVEEGERSDPTGWE